MQSSDLESFKSTLKCTFCRNPLTNDEITIKEYKGDFVSVWCPNCSNLPKQCGPKFLICLCSKEPKELEIEMAKSEIENIVKEVTFGGGNKGLIIDKKEDNNEVSKMSGKRNRSNTTRF